MRRQTILLIGIAALCVASCERADSPRSEPETTASPAAEATDHRATNTTATEPAPAQGADSYAADDVNTEAIGNCSGHTCNPVYIERLLVANNSIKLLTSADESGLDNCTVDAYGYMHLDMTSAHSKEIYSALLAAHMADKKVRIRTVDNVNPCTVLYVTLDR